MVRFFVRKSKDSAAFSFTCLGCFPRRLLRINEFSLLPSCLLLRLLHILFLLLAPFLLGRVRAVSLGSRLELLVLLLVLLYLANWLVSGHWVHRLLVLGGETVRSHHWLLHLQRHDWRRWHGDIDGDLSLYYLSILLLCSILLYNFLCFLEQRSFRRLLFFFLLYFSGFFDDFFRHLFELGLHLGLVIHLDRGQ